MHFEVTNYLGRTTFITGPEKHCGKTTFMNRVLALCSRAASADPGALKPPAVLTVGYDGEARDYLSGARKPSVPVAVGDLFVTAERFLRPSGVLPEILELVPGSTALGKIVIARARRAGNVALVGPEGNSSVAWILRSLASEGWADTVLVDGAINRITQVAGIAGASFVYAMRVDKVNFRKSEERMRRLSILSGLPVFREGDTGEKREHTAFVQGALTSQTAAAIPDKTEIVVVDDFTKIFLEATELAAFLRGRKLQVRESIRFGGFAIACRGLSMGEFLQRLSPEIPRERIFPNLYQDEGVTA